MPGISAEALSPAPVPAPVAAGSHAGPSLLRALGAWDVSLITIGSVVGSAIFIAAAMVPREMPQPGVLLALWVAGGLICAAGAVTFAELGAMFPEAGGQYHYLKAAYGPLYGFLFGWTAFLVIQCGAIAYLAIASADRLGAFVPFFLASNVVASVPIGTLHWDINGSQLGAALAIFVLSAINYLGLRAGAGFQNFVTLVKIGTLLAIIGFGLAAPPAAEPQWHAPLPQPDTVRAFGLAMIGVLWCYDGWYQATFCAGEIRDPGRNLPRGLILGTLLTMLLYFFVNLVYLRALPMLELGRADGIGEAAAGALFGPQWGRLVTVGVLVSVFGCLSTCVLTGARIYLPMAQDGVFFRALAKIDPVRRTPSACIVAQGAWSAVLAFTGTYEQLGTYVIFAVFVFHAATGVAVIVLRRTQPDRPRPYRTWGYPWTPIVFILSALAFVLNTVTVRPVESLWGVLLVALGLPAWWWWRRNPPAPESA
jgi:APA family basic amino acid/polyamine antiporter